jgi:tRNA threonylcarbamoyladenosine biosynthesis protein TsaE
MGRATRWAGLCDQWGYAIGRYTDRQRRQPVRERTMMPEPPVDFLLPDPSATEALGVALARAFPGALQGSAVIYLQGELGAGKTTCVRSLLRTLGVRGVVRSPTYTLMEAYALAQITCIHLDLYRLQSPLEVDELGLRDYLVPGSLLLIEWPERGGRFVPPADVQLSLTYDGDARRARLWGYGNAGAAWLSNLAVDTSLAPYVSNLT